MESSLGIHFSNRVHVGIRDAVYPDERVGKYHRKPAVIGLKGPDAAAFAHGRMGATLAAPTRVGEAGNLRIILFGIGGFRVPLARGR